MNKFKIQKIEGQSIFVKIEPVLSWEKLQEKKEKKLKICKFK